MNKINVEKVIDYIKVLDNNELLQDMNKILRNENTNLKLEIERLNTIIKEAKDYINNHQLVFELSSKKQIEDWFDMFYKQLLEILKGDKHD